MVFSHQHTQHNWLSMPALPKTHSFCEKIWAHWQECYPCSHSKQAWEYGLIKVTQANGLADRRQNPPAPPAPLCPDVRLCRDLLSPMAVISTSVAGHQQPRCCQKCKNFSPISPLLHLWFPKYFQFFFFFNLYAATLFLMFISFPPFYVWPSCFGKRKKWKKLQTLAFP